MKMAIWWTGGAYPAGKMVGPAIMVAAMNRDSAERSQSSSRHGSAGRCSDGADRDSAAARHSQAGRFADAEEGSYGRSWRSEPNRSTSLHLLGVIAFHTERRDLAMDIIGKALIANPKEPSIDLSRGNLLLQQCRLEEAVASYQRALRLQPGLGAAMTNLGNALQALRVYGRVPRGLSRGAGAATPDNPEAHFGLAMLLLSRGDMAQGWEEHEWRWQSRVAGGSRKVFTQPQWRGEVAEGQCLLVHCEQGFGDTLHFCRYIPPRGSARLASSSRLRRCSPG